jgi:hypothetical protein
VTYMEQKNTEPFQRGTGPTDLHRALLFPIMLGQKVLTSMPKNWYFLLYTINRHAAKLIFFYLWTSIFFWQEKELGREATALELFLHLHVQRVDGQSIVLTRAISAKQARQEEIDALRDEDLSDDEELRAAEEEVPIIAPVETYDADSLEFANIRTKAVYVSSPLYISLKMLAP